MTTRRYQIGHGPDSGWIYDNEKVCEVASVCDASCWPLVHDANTAAELRNLIPEAAFPTPWVYEWDEHGPRVIDAEGKCVARFSTGTIEGAYESAAVLAVMRLLCMAANGIEAQL